MEQLQAKVEYCDYVARLIGKNCVQDQFAENKDRSLLENYSHSYRDKKNLQDLLTIENDVYGSGNQDEASSPLIL